ncbi:MAG: Eco57I restriction-modification methylase domain-containing protein [Gemmatimonadaceae bacterium]
MLTVRTAAALVGAADSLDALAALVAAVGVTGAPQTLDAPHRAELNLPRCVRHARVAAGPGMARALLVLLDDGPPLRDQLLRLAARLQTRAPHVSWLLAVTDARTPTVALAAWTAERRPPAVRCLVADRVHLVDSDAQTVCALAAAACTDHVLLHLRWTEVLGRDTLSRRFYGELEQRVASIARSAPGSVPLAERRALALLHTSRLLFLAFLEAKRWLDDDRAFLGNAFDACMARGGGFHARVLLPLFFGTLSTPRARRAAAARAFGRVPFLNGGLFAPTALERRHRDLRFGDEAFGALIGGLFTRYRFTAREDAATWSDAAIDPEMLGHAFESLMAADERQDTGAFFTPQRLVERITDTALAHALDQLGVPEPQAARLLAQGVVPDGDADALRRRLAAITVLDPACGSGAFLVHALHRLAELHVRLGDRRALTDVRRDVVTRSLFGVDRNPIAVWLCELRLWLSVVIECQPDDPMAVAPLPNLDRNVRVGDSLAGAGFVQPPAGGRSHDLALLRRRYAQASGTRKAALARLLDRGERARALAMLERAIAGARHARAERLAACRARDLFGQRHGVSSADRDQLAAFRRRATALQREHRRLTDGGALPFSFSVHFADVAARGGFHVVIGNPPWVRPHRVPAAERASLRHAYAVFRHAAWSAGAAAAHASAGFAGQADLSALFVERGVALLRPGGALALLLPAKLWRSLAGGGVRRLLLERTRLTRLEDLSDAPAAFDAAVYPSILALRRVTDDAAPPPTTFTAAVQRGHASRVWEQTPSALALDDSPGSPWLLLPPDVRRAFEQLGARATPMAQSVFGRPLLGVKCGYNEAFVVRVIDANAHLARIRAADGRTGTIERALLRPMVRGETVAAWRAISTDEQIVWPCDARGEPLRELPPFAAHWLGHWKRRLMARTDARGSRAWWSLFRTEGAAADAPRVVWADFGRRPRALVLAAGHPAVPLNTCYVARCPSLDDARALAAILNSSIAAAWLHVLAEPARGNFRRYLGWTMARLPLPRDWPRARRLLAPRVAELDERPDLDDIPPAELTRAVLRAYALQPRALAPLIAWTTP